MYTEKPLYTNGYSSIQSETTTSKKGFKTLLDVEQEQNTFKNKNEEKQEEYEHELTYTDDDFTPEQYDRLMRREMSKEEMIQILKEKKNVR